MTNTELKKGQIISLMNKYGKELFEKDGFAVPNYIISELVILAKEAKYQKPRNGYCCKGRHYFYHLQKIYYKSFAK